jgi:hypothetical protein
MKFQLLIGASLLLLASTQPGPSQEKRVGAWISHDVFFIVQGHNRIDPKVIEGTAKTLATAC